MLEIVIKGDEFYNYETEEFVYKNSVAVQLEHSLSAVSKWEAKHKIAFLGKVEKTPEQILDYYRCMAITPDVPEGIWYKIDEKNIKDIQDYIEDPHTATAILARPGQKSQDVPTSDLIYYWMFSLEIPLEAEKWHLNKLFALIKVFDAKNNQSKVDPKSAAQQRAAINAANRQKLGLENG